MNNHGGARPGAGRPKKKTTDELVWELWMLTNQQPKLKSNYTGGKDFWSIVGPEAPYASTFLCYYDEGIREAYIQAIKLYGSKV